MTKALPRSPTRFWLSPPRSTVSPRCTKPRSRAAIQMRQRKVEFIPYCPPLATLATGVSVDHLGPPGQRTQRHLEHLLRTRVLAAGRYPLRRRTRVRPRPGRPRPGPLRRPVLHRLAPPRHPGLRSTPVPHHPPPDQPKSIWGSLTLYKIIRELQTLLATWSGTCPTCHQHIHPLPT